MEIHVGRHCAAHAMPAVKPKHQQPAAMIGQRYSLIAVILHGLPRAKGGGAAWAESIGAWQAVGGTTLLAGRHQRLPFSARHGLGSGARGDAESMAR